MSIMLTLYILSVRTPSLGMDLPILFGTLSYSKTIVDFVNCKSQGKRANELPQLTIFRNTLDECGYKLTSILLDPVCRRAGFGRGKHT